MDPTAVRSVLNPLQAADLVRILEMTLPSRRLVVALAFSGLTQTQLLEAAGLNKAEIPKQNGMLSRIIRGKIKIPSVYAVRISRALGVPIELLCEFHLCKL